MSLHERMLDRRNNQWRATRAQSLVAKYEPLIQSVAKTSVAEPELAQAVVSESILVLLTMPESDRTRANVVATTRRIAFDMAERFARAVL